MHNKKGLVALVALLLALASGSALARDATEDRVDTPDRTGHYSIGNTLQVAIYSSGKIELTIGELAATGPAYTPKILGTIGIASGQTKAIDLRKTRPIKFGKLTDGAPLVLPFGRDGAIYEQYYLGTDASCHNDDDDDDGDSAASER